MGKTRMIKVGAIGSPDIIGICPKSGRFFGIECKRKGKKQSDLQLQFERDILANNGLYFVVDDYDGIEVVAKMIINNK